MFFSVLHLILYLSFTHQFQICLFVISSQGPASNLISLLQLCLGRQAKVLPSRITRNHKNIEKLSNSDAEEKNAKIMIPDLLKRFVSVFGNGHEPLQDLQIQQCNISKVSLLRVKSLWGDCTFIPADQGSQQQICAILLFLKTFHYKND